MGDKRESCKGRLKTIFEDMRVAYGDWAVKLGAAGAVFALFSFFSDVLAAPLSDIGRTFLDAYRGFFHAPFRAMTHVFAINTPTWLRDFLVFWLLSGGIGGRVHLNLTRTYLEGVNARYEDLKQRLAEPEKATALERQLGGPEKLQTELGFMEEQIQFSRETLHRRRLLIFGCLVTGPLFMAGLAWFNPPVLDRPYGTRRLLAIDVTGIVAATIFMFVLNWSLDADGVSRVNSEKPSPSHESAPQ